MAKRRLQNVPVDHWAKKHEHSTLCWPECLADRARRLEMNLTPTQRPANGWKCVVCEQKFTSWAPAERHANAGHHRLELNLEAG